MYSVPPVKVSKWKAIIRAWGHELFQAGGKLAEDTRTRDGSAPKIG